MEQLPSFAELDSSPEDLPLTCEGTEISERQQRVHCWSSCPASQSASIPPLTRRSRERAPSFVHRFVSFSLFPRRAQGTCVPHAWPSTYARPYHKIHWGAAR